MFVILSYQLEWEVCATQKTHAAIWAIRHYRKVSNSAAY